MCGFGARVVFAKTFSNFFTIGLTSVVCGVWKLVGVQRLEGSLFYVPQGSCESTSHALCTNFQRLVILYYASSGVALPNESTVSDDSTVEVCPPSPTCE